MAATDHAVSCIHFSTRDRPKGERVPFWCEFFGRNIIRTRIEPASDTRFDAQGTLWSVPGLRVHWSSYSAGARVLRPRELISAKDDNIALLIDRTGTAVFSQAGREVALEQGGGVAVLQTEPASMVFPRVRHMAVMAPLKALSPLTGSVEDRAGNHIPHNTEPLRLLARYVDRLGRSLQDLVGFLSEIHALGVDLYLHQQGIDTTTPAGKAMFQMMGVFADYADTAVMRSSAAGMQA
jgi:hypothetical protein